MGCFNMECVVTGVPIMQYDDVVMIELAIRKEYATLGDMFGDDWHLASMPKFGKYNDYGDIETQENDEFKHINDMLTSESKRMNLTLIEYHNNEPFRMFILRSAWDAMMAEKFDMSGHSSERRLKAVAEYDKPSDYTDPDDMDNVGKRILEDMKKKELLYTAFGINDTDAYVWYNIVKQYREIGDWYYDHYSKLYKCAKAMHWTVRPSKYAGQDVCEDKLQLKAKLQQDAVNAIVQKFKEWDLE